MTYDPDHDAVATPDRRQSLHEQWREVSARIDAEEAAKAAARADHLAEIAGAGTTDAAGRAPRHDGWTPDRQRAFLAAIADGDTVERACRRVGLSAAGAYALRQRAAGAGFALGWKAASLLGRDVIADRMMTRALDGQVETVTRADGSIITRHRYDNRTAMAMLARLDRMAEQLPDDPAAAASSHAARLVAQDFEAFLDLIEQDRGPARAGLFLARRTGLTGAPAAAPELEPILALARADRFTRTGASLAEEVDTSDLDPAQRHAWTAEQWQRADAAGLLRVLSPGDAEEAAPVDDPADDPADDPEYDDAAASLFSQLNELPPIYWNDAADEYRTHLPPPDGELPEFESHDYGDEDYDRSLTAREQALIGRRDEIRAAERRAVAAAFRDEWFAYVEADIAAVEQGDHARAPGESRDPGSGCPMGEDVDEPLS